LSVTPKVVSPGDALTITGEFVVTSEIFDKNSFQTLEVVIDGKKEENINIVRPTQDDEKVKEIKIPMISEVPSGSKDKGYRRTIVVKVNQTSLYFAKEVTHAPFSSLSFHSHFQLSTYHHSADRMPASGITSIIKLGNPGL
jgi:hypothetical protein